MECTVLDENGGVLSTVTITAGQAAVMEADGFITIAEFNTGNLPAFVAGAMSHSDDWNLPPSAEGGPEPEPVGEDTVNPADYSRFFKGPRILRCLEYSFMNDGTEYLIAYEEFLYDEQGNYIGYGHYSRSGDDWILDHTRTEKYLFDGQGRIQELQSQFIDSSGEAGNRGILTTMEQGPDYVVLGDEHTQGRYWYYYNDLNQCVRTEYGTSDPLGSYTTYEYDAQGRIILSEYYSADQGRRSRYAYEYEGDVSAIDGPEESAENTPEDSQTPELPEDTGKSLLAPYVGTYTPYPAYDYYSYGRSVTLAENGVFTGGETDGRTPASISQNADGSIAILFGTDERYTVYPVGVPTPS